MTHTEPSTAPRHAPFGRVLCAMVTPFAPDGSLDLEGARRLADHLVTEGCEGLVLSGTTGESPTTTDEEKSELIAVVADAVHGRASVIAGVGTADTRHSIELTLAAHESGADAVLVTAPYYSRPPQEAVETHLERIADASPLPLMLYDIPGRTGTRIEPATTLRLAAHPRITAVKDCSNDPLGIQQVMAGSDLAVYAGSEEHILPLYAVGGAGFVSTVANLAPGRLRAVLDAYDRGDTEGALQAQRSLLPLVHLMMAAGLPGTVTAKALLDALGFPAGEPRAPLPAASAERRAELLHAHEQLVRRPS